MSNKSKISIVTGPMSGHGGEETLLISFVNNLSKTYDFELYLGDVLGDTNWLNQINSGVKKIFPSHHINLGIKYKKYLCFLLGTDSDVIIVFSPTMILIASYVRKVFKKNYKLVAWPQFSISDYFSNRMKKYFLLADYFLAISNGLKNQLINMGVSSDKIFLVYNPINKSKYVINPTKYETVKFIFVGRIQFREEKNLKELFDACSFLTGNWCLEIWGQDNNLNQKNLKLCKDYIENLNIKENIYWMGWNSNVWEKLENADCLILTSKSEGFGLVLCEAISRGMPVISSNCDVGPKDIVNIDNGFLYELGNVKQLSRIMQGFIEREYAWDVNKLKQSLNEFYDDNYYIRFKKYMDFICEE